YPPQDLLLYDGFVEQVERIIKEELAPLTAAGPAMLLGAPFRVGGELYNTAVQLEDGQIRAIHRKSLLPHYDVFDEQRYFVRSPERKIVPVKGLASAVTVCEDMWNDRDLHPRPLYDLDPLEDL